VPFRGGHKTVGAEILNLLDPLDGILLNKQMSNRAIQDFYEALPFGIPLPVGQAMAKPLGYILACCEMV